MKLYYLLFVVLSAFLHAFYNFLMRRSAGSRVFIAWMCTVAGIIALGLAIITGSDFSIPWQFVPFIFGAALFYSSYQILVSKSYERGEMSKYYPLTVLSPIFIPFWAFFFLSEKISVLTGLGIVATIIGALIVKLNAFSFGEFRKMFRFGQDSQDYLGARFAIGASLMYSFGSVLDKAKIALFPLLVYHVILLSFMALNTAVYVRFFEKESMMDYFFKNWKSILLAGGIVFCSFLTFRIALRAVPVSIVVPVRQIAIIFAILLGVFSLKEEFRLSSLIGSLIIILGIVLVNLGI